MARRRRHAPPIEMTVSIESMTNDSRGVAHHDGKAVFVDGALPGEVVLCQTTRRSSKYDEAKVLEVLDASDDRVQPRCSASGICGGCSLQHMSDASQIHAKQQVLIDNLQKIGKVEPEAILSPLQGAHWNYRRKARLGVKLVPKKGGVLVGFREKQSGYLAVMDSCEVLDDRFSQLIIPLRRLIEKISIAKRIPQIEIAAGDDQGILVFRHLEPLLDSDLELLKDFGRQKGLSIMLQSGGPDSIVALYPETIELLEYRLDEWDISIRFRPSDFTQINAGINKLMIAKAVELLAPEEDDEVLDLFCGVGNFTLPLSRITHHVMGIEADSALVQMARENAIHNGIANAEFITADLYDTPLDGSWLHQKWDRILLDPPRSGALEVLERLPELQAKRIVYVSCNPATLARDSGILVHRHNYKLTATGVMDMFPHTKHVESIAIFEPT
ncbi:23S rRNA (uracil(1939)-C(5))-methyltransferase RlmD [bacterium BMS3Bbin11]|nr:23S rRNA (uracil(1939)-C(5))-methyltransferase RlmD [bacterium BMS3Abin11]GBE46310.1 23S rRNA (uracil(1939)-C(5))-methyltransferase RlmD [bacterium BMS3Bbin11]GMT40859.1 MAG: 23S rRNA (uracil(1939)-C(5))-methyltransferase RlmD [bacterium]HDH09016.1 23S rRNA (uracil(1939)-C(5))-methyltransferase RlmD [Gammaproteobacteria bacterium]HDH16796.1 23S rRNA (uracil(1939)-C(5))-methyltransferase RlmD [Gammaproteobacteria bacterium]